MFHISEDYTPGGKGWDIDLDKCKSKKPEQNLLCYVFINFGDNITNRFFCPSKGTPQEEEYYVDFQLEDNSFTNFHVENSERMGLYALCTFKDVEFTQSINETESNSAPNFGDLIPYGEVNCYDEGKRYSNIVPDLET